MPKRNCNCPKCKARDWDDFWRIIEANYSESELDDIEARAIELALFHRHERGN